MSNIKFNHQTKGEKIRQLLLPLVGDPTGDRARFELHWQITEADINPIRITDYPDGHIPGAAALPRHWKLQAFVHSFTLGRNEPVIEPFYNTGTMDTLEYFMDSVTEPTLDQFLEDLHDEIKRTSFIIVNADPEYPYTDTYFWDDQDFYNLRRECEAHDFASEEGITVDMIYKYAITSGIDPYTPTLLFIEQYGRWQWRFTRIASLFYQLRCSYPCRISDDQALELLNLDTIAP